MRIIAGTFRSRRLLAPPDDRTTRPITDRVKQSLFDRLVAMEAMGGHVLDVFAGTGSLGLEALSRGADHVTFVERDRNARGLLERNIEALGAAGQASVLRHDALSAGWVHLLPRTPLRLVFLDPPFPTTRDPRGMSQVLDLARNLAPVAEPEGVLVLRTEAQVTPAAVEGWQGPTSHVYGSMALHFYVKQP